MNKFINVVIETKLPNQLFHVLASVGFWNAEGVSVYEKNKVGIMGSKFTQEQANKLTYEEFTLNSLHEDIKTFSKATSKEYWPEGFKSGKGGSHIWVCNEKNERVLLIHFDCKHREISDIKN